MNYGDLRQFLDDQLMQVFIPRRMVRQGKLNLPTLITYPSNSRPTRLHSNSMPMEALCFILSLEPRLPLIRPLSIIPCPIRDLFYSILAMSHSISRSLPFLISSIPLCLPISRHILFLWLCYLYRTKSVITSIYRILYCLVLLLSSTRPTTY